MIQIDIEIGIIEIRATLEGLVAEVVTIAMLLFRTLNSPIILGMIKLAATVMHLRTKNFEESASKWKRRLIEWKIRYGENERDLKTVIALNTQIMVMKRITEVALIIQEIRKAKNQVTCLKQLMMQSLKLMQIHAKVERKTFRVTKIMVQGAQMGVFKPGKLMRNGQTRKTYK